MINAGVSILAFSGGQEFDTVSGEWRHILVDVHYPEGQNATDNPPNLGDLLISTSGIVWQVVLVHPWSASDGNTFEINIQSTNRTPSEDVSPGMGQVARAALLTPVRGNLVPHWSSQLVAAEVDRLARLYSLELDERDNTADVDKPISNAQQDALDLKVDKVAGKGLSTNDYTDAEKSKLAGIETGAERNVGDEFTAVNYYQKTEVDQLQQDRSVHIRCNNWSSGDFTLPDGVSVSKEYDDSSLRITHGRNRQVASWLVVNRESDPMTAITPTSLRNMQVVNDNEVIVTSISSFEVFDVVLTLA